MVRLSRPSLLRCCQLEPFFSFQTSASDNFPSRSRTCFSDNLRALFSALATTIGYEPTESELTKAVAIVFKRSEKEIRTTLRTPAGP
jgi:hypothetical protein